MDDLTKLPLVGRATAKKLIAAGIDSFEKVARAGHADLRAVLDSANSFELQALQNAATNLMQPAPLDLAKAQDSEIAAQAARIDGAQEEITAIPAGSHVGAEGQNASHSPSEGPGGDEAVNITETAPKPDALATASGAHTTQSDDDQEGGAGNSAGPAAEISVAGDDFATFLSSEAGNVLLEKQIAGVLETVRELAANGDLQAALDHLTSERANAAAMTRMAQRVDAVLAAEEIVLARSATCWPLEVIRYDGQERPIGEPLAIEPDIMARLVAAGAVADHAPEAEKQEA